MKKTVLGLAWLFFSTALAAQIGSGRKFFPEVNLLFSEKLEISERYLYLRAHQALLRHEMATGLTEYLNYPLDSLLGYDWPILTAAQTDYFADLVAGNGDTLFLATSGKTYRFDGNGWSAMDLPPNTQVLAFDHPQGRLLDFRSGVLYAIQGQQEQPISPPIAFTASDMAVSPDGQTIWLTSPTEGLARFEGNTWAFWNTANGNLATDFLQQIVETTDTSVFFLDQQQNLYACDGAVQTLLFASALDLSASPNGDLWAALSNGELWTKSANQPWSLAPNAAPSHLAVDAHGDLWGFQDDNTLVQLRNGQARTVPLLQTIGNYGRHLFLDRQGAPAYTALGKTQFSYNGRYWLPTFEFQERISNGIWDGNGTFWGTVLNGLPGLYREDTLHQSFLYTPQNSGLLGHPLEIKLGYHDILWFRINDSTLQSFDGNQFQTVIFPGILRGFAPALAPGGGVWASVWQHGIYQWQNGNLTHHTQFINPAPLPGTTFNGIFADEQGSVWAFGHAIYRYDGTGTWDGNHYSPPVYLPVASAETDVVRDTSGRLWFFEEGQTRLFCFDPNLHEITTAYEGIPLFAALDQLLVDGQNHFWIYEILGNPGGYYQLYDTAAAFVFANQVHPQRLMAQVFYDVDGNGVRDAGEPGLPRAAVQAQPGGRVWYTDARGRAYPFLDGPAQATLSAVPPGNGSWTLTTDSASYFAVFPALQDTLVFGFDVQAPFGQLELDLQPIGFFRCSATQEPVAQLRFANTGSDTCRQARLTLAVDTLMGQPTGSPLPALINGHEIIWDFTALAPFEDVHVFAIGDMPGFNYLGDTLAFQATLVCGPDTVHDELHRVLTCAYDPNDKQVAPQGPAQGETTLLNTPLEYRVRFQNTGNDTAFLVVVRDTLDAGLDPETFVFLQASHPCEVERQGRSLTFRFSPIQLPDSTTDFTGSQGFLAFRVAPYPQQAPATIRNTAHIFFDSNPAVVTNTARTLYVDSFPVVGAISAAPDPVSVGVRPNPAQTVAQFVFGETLDRAGALVLFNALGQPVRYLDLPTGTAQIEVQRQNLPAGLYWWQIFLGGRPSAVGRLVWTD
jgi:uncharacterized repeat protein (TIGR01451 family)